MGKSDHCILSLLQWFYFHKNGKIHTVGLFDVTWWLYFEELWFNAYIMFVLPSTGTLPWNSSSSPTPFWGLLCLRLWVCSVWWWRSSSCSPCKRTNNTTPYTSASLHPGHLRPLPSIRRVGFRTGTLSQQMGHSSQKEEEILKIRG